MSANLYVPYEFMCQKHQQEICKIDLTPGIKKEKRLFCSECQCDQSTTFSIETAFEFLADIQIKYSNIKEDLERNKKNIQETSKACQKYFDDLDQKFTEWEVNLESKKLIKQELLESMLQRKQQYSTLQLMEFLEGLSDKLEIINDVIKVKKPYFSKNDQQFKVNLAKQLQEFTVILRRKDILEYQINEPIQQQIIEEVNLYNKKTEVLFPNEINVIEFNKDGNLLAVGNQAKVDDCFLSIWNLDESNQLSLVQRMKDHTKVIRSICFSSQNDSFLSGSYDCTAILWKRKFKNQWINDRKFENQTTINCLQFNHSAEQIAIGTSKLEIWRKQQSEKWESFQIIEDHKKKILCLKFNENDTILVSADLTKQILVSKYQDDYWMTVYWLQCANESIRSLSFLNQYEFVSVSINSEIIFWMFQDSIQEYECKIQKLDQQVQSASYSNNQKFLVLQSENSIQVFEIHQQSLNSLQIMKININIMQLSKDASKLAIFADSKLQIYTKKNGN